MATMTIDSTRNVKPLTNPELQEVTGGTSGVKTVRYVTSPWGRIVGEYGDEGQIYYWKCSHCGGPCHSDGLYWCDLCDDWWFMRRGYLWHGTAEELWNAAH